MSWPEQPTGRRPRIQRMDLLWCARCSYEAMPGCVRALPHRRASWWRLPRRERSILCTACTPGSSGTTTAMLEAGCGSRISRLGAPDSSGPTSPPISQPSDVCGPFGSWAPWSILPAHRGPAPRVLASAATTTTWSSLRGQWPALWRLGSCYPLMPRYSDKARRRRRSGSSGHARQTLHRSPRCGSLQLPQSRAARMPRTIADSRPAGRRQAHHNWYKSAHRIVMGALR